MKYRSDEGKPLQFVVFILILVVKKGQFFHHCSLQSLGLSLIFTPVNIFIKRGELSSFYPARSSA